jgi:hypothetical protein
MRKVRTVVACLAAAVIASAGPAFAQMRQISGSVTDATGRPLSGITVTAEQIDTSECCTKVANVRSQSDGVFLLEVPPGVYAVAADPPPPRGLARARVDVRTAAASGIALRVPSGPAPFVADDSPKAPLIQLGTPNDDGETTVTGSAGSVPGGTYVIVIALRSGIISTVQAAADGSFETRLRAPRGTWVMMKHDPIGTTYRRIVLETQGGEGSPAPLAGTLLRVADPPGPKGLSFGDEGTLPGNHRWRVEGTIDKARLQPGDRLTANVRFVLESPAIADLERIPLSAHLLLERLAGSDVLGPRARSFFTSNLMTPTGFPIEKGENYSEQNSGFARFDVVRVSPGRAEGSFPISFTVSSALSTGHYRAAMRFFLETRIPSAPRSPHITIDKPSRQPPNFAYLPLVTVGDPLPPRLPVMLLANQIGNATQGIRAIDDYSAFGLASRIALQSDTLVIPRTDIATGLPVRYRFEPYLPWVSVGDRGIPPDPPIVPFRLPSGGLTVRIEKPSGATETIGPAPFLQARTRTIVDRHGVALTPGGSGGSVTEPYELSTMDPRFEIAFDEEGLHRIRLEMTVEDERGITWSGGGTYPLHVARELWIDSGILPGTPFIVGNRPHLGGVLYPPMAADIEFRLRFAPASEAGKLVDRTLRTRSNRFGAFLIPESFTFTEPGEYRIDAIAAARDADGRAWAGTRTWGGVVAEAESTVIAHGQRGIDDLPRPRPQWFFRSQTGSPMGPTHVFLPFHSGDVAWMERRDSTQPMITFQDPAGLLLSRVKPSIFMPRDFDDDAAIGEAPLLIGRRDGVDGHVEPARNDLWGYSYRSIQRPFVRVREEISDQSCNGCYWRFREHYAAQAGVGRDGDLPNDFKFQFGGVVLRGPAIGRPVYAAYASLFILVRDSEERGGTRVFPPFQGNGGGPSGGPLFTLRGRDIDLFFHPTGVRPGTILHAGDTASFAGYSAPTLPSKIEIAVSSPSGAQRTIKGQANKIGYFYDPGQNFTVSEPGVWKAKVKIVFDGQLGFGGQVEPPYPAGDALGSREGEFYFYVVDGQSSPLEIAAMPQFVRPVEGPITFRITPPAGLRNAEMTYTTVMPGFILEEGKSSTLTYTYDAPRLAKDFPNLDLFDADGFAGVDTITMSFLVSGTDAAGARRHFARQIVLQGEELQMPDQKARPRRRP